MTSKFNPRAVENVRVFRYISYSLVFLMLACIVMTISSLIQGAVPSWHAGIISGIMLFMIADRLYIHDSIKHLQPFSTEWARNLGAQWLVVIIFIRLLLSYVKGPDAFIADMLLFAHGNIEKFFSPEFVVSVLLAALAWYLSGQFLELLDEIGLDQVLASYQSEVLPRDEAVPVQRRLVNMVFSIGILLVILAALARIDLRAILSGTSVSTPTDPNPWSGAEAGALFYFIFGLVLLSQSRLMSLQTQWNLQNIPVASNDLAKQWGTYSLLFLLFLVLIVGFLPTGSGGGFFSLLGELLGFLISVLFLVGQLILILLWILFSLISWLLGKGLPPMYKFPTMPPTPLAPAELQLHSASSVIWALLKSTLLWGSLLVIICFSLLHFLKQRKDLLSALRKMHVANWLIHVWQWLRINANKTRDDFSRALTDGWQNIVARLERRRIFPRLGLISLGQLDPRRQIYFFYLAMVRRGSEQGLARKPSQTPSEYAVTLEKGLPTSSKDIDTITEAFTEARYSRHAVTATESNLVKATWGRIRKALRSKSNDRQSRNK